MAEEKKRQLQAVDLVGIGSLLEDLIAKDMITCEERDRIIQRIVADYDFPDYKLSILAGYRAAKMRCWSRQRINTQMIACEFALWLVPEFKILLLKLSLGRKQQK